TVRPDFHPGFLSAGMLDYITKRFLGNAVEADGYLPRHRAQLSANMEPHPYPFIPAEFFAMAAESRDQPQVLQSCRVKLMRHVTQLVTQSLGTVPQPGKLFANGGRSLGKLLTKHSELHC